MVAEGALLWEPSEEIVARARLTGYLQSLGRQGSSYEELWQWSVDHPADFWTSIWDHFEVMASGGIAYLGRTGEDYAVPFGNSVVVQSDDPRELLTSHLMLRDRPELARSIRTDGKATAKRFVWPRILEGYESVWDTAFALSS